MSDRIAVVGAGVSGLVAAQLLAREHDVVVYEAEQRPGGHAHTVSVGSRSGPLALDVAFLIHEPAGYPNFHRLVVAAHELPTRHAPMGMSIAGGGGLEWSSTARGLLELATRLGTSEPRRMARDMVRFNRAARKLSHDDPRPLSFEEFLAAHDMSPQFVARLIAPQVAGLWSLPTALMLDAPAHLVAGMLDHFRLAQLRRRGRFRTIVGGSERYVGALARSLGGRLRLGCPVGRVVRDDDGVLVEAGGRSPERFEHVVVALHADDALAVLSDASEVERDVLGAMPYHRTQGVLHTDASLMPRRRTAWASWNFRLGAHVRDPHSLTYWLNAIMGLDGVEDFFVTLHRVGEVDPRRVIRSFEYSHPLVCAAARRAQLRWAEVSGRARTHLCGAYWGWGFHEDGVASAIRATTPLLARPEPLALGRRQSAIHLSGQRSALALAGGVAGIG